ncbi:MAG: OmpA family protein [Deltaproteobacteria bacterium]|nr:OmpA family protein [Deltaproteobacteria bacterium]
MRRAICAAICLPLMSCAAGASSTTTAGTEPEQEVVLIEKDIVDQAPEKRADRSLAPYLWVPGGDEDVDRLPLESTSADVQIAGVIARVTVTQVFGNDGDVPIEAEYVFPGSTRAAVHGMRMTIGERTVEAQIQEKQQAKATYEAAKSAGKVTSLLEQKRRNVFSMRVANIMPGEKIQVVLEYSELLVPQEGTYELVYPAVVGPRYGGGANPVEDKWVESPYTPEGQPEMYDFSVEVLLASGIPLTSVSSPSHSLHAIYETDSRVHVTPAEEGGGNRDFVLRWKLADDAIETGVLLSPGDDGGYFAVMMEPPPRPRPEQITPREYIFVLDVSGSMSGFPIETARTLMKDLLLGLRPDDRFNMILFAGSSYTHSPDSLTATEANVEHALQVVKNAPAGGGTEILDALRTAYAIPKTDRMSRSVIVVTDGYVAVEAQCYEHIRNHLGQANVFAFGIGSSVNRGIIESMALAGMGEPFVVLDASEADDEAARFRAYIQSPVLTGITVSFKGLDVVNVLPAPTAVPDLLASRPLVLVGRYRGDPAGTITVKGTTGSEDFSKSLDVKKLMTDEGTGALRVLWARKWIDLWEDGLKMAGSNEGLGDRITEMGLEHSILTSRTSFVAVDSLIINKTGKLEGVDQPSPMPQGVSNASLGGGDADGDGIPDGADSCPYDPEVYNGLEDGDGCPDKGKIEIKGCEIVIMDKIYFKSGSSTIKPVSHAILDAVAATMIGNPQIMHVHVAGYADAKEKSPAKLSRKRARAAIDYLVSKGVDASRLSTAGYGKHCPVDKGKSKAALEKNRRVEFRILETTDGCTNVSLTCDDAVDAGLVPADVQKYLPGEKYCQ